MSEKREKEISRKNLFIKSGILIGSFATLTAGSMISNIKENKVLGFFKKIIQQRIKYNCAVVKSVKGRINVNNTQLKAGDLITGGQQLTVNKSSEITFILEDKNTVKIKGKSIIDMDMFLMRKGAGNRLMTSLPEIFTDSTPCKYMVKGVNANLKLDHSDFSLSLKHIVC